MLFSRFTGEENVESDCLGYFELINVQWCFEEALINQAVFFLSHSRRLIYRLFIVLECSLRVGVQSEGVMRKECQVGFGHIDKDCSDQHCLSCSSRNLLHSLTSLMTLTPLLNKETASST